MAVMGRDYENGRVI